MKRPTPKGRVSRLASVAIMPLVAMAVMNPLPCAANPGAGTHCSESSVEAMTQNVSAPTIKVRGVSKDSDGMTILLDGTNLGKEILVSDIVVTNGSKQLCGNIKAFQFNEGNLGIKYSIPGLENLTNANLVVVANGQVFELALNTDDLSNVAKQKQTIVVDGIEQPQAESIEEVISMKEVESITVALDNRILVSSKK